MDTRLLRYFVEVARHRNFTRASDLLHITQPTLSKMIKNLEEELGVTLLDRSSRHVQLTDAGEMVYARAQQIAKSLEDLTTELDELRGLIRGTVRIGIPPTAGTPFFPRVLAGFHAQYPQITMRLHEHGAKRVEQELLDGLLDVGVSAYPIDEGAFEAFPFVHEYLRLVVHPGHRLAGASGVTLDELRGESFILYREDFALHGQIRRECRGVGFEPFIVCESSQWDFIGESVAANLGVALLPETLCRRLDARRVTTVPLVQPAIPWHLVLIWRRGQYLSFAARAWIAYAQAHLPVLGERSEGGAGEGGGRAGAGEGGV